MSDCNVTVTVPSSSPGTFLYSVNGGPSQAGCINLAEVDKGDALTFILTLQPETADATVAFNTATPLQFVDWQGQNLNDPMWYNPSLTENDTVLTFTDDSLNVFKRTYYFKINATYDGSPRTSTDPTIINAGTGGDDWIEEKVEVIVTETVV